MKHKFYVTIISPWGIYILTTLFILFFPSPVLFLNWMSSLLFPCALPLISNFSSFFYVLNTEICSFGLTEDGSRIPGVLVCHTYFYLYIYIFVCVIFVWRIFFFKGGREGKGKGEEKCNHSLIPIVEKVDPSKNAIWLQCGIWYSCGERPFKDIQFSACSWVFARE